MRFFIQLVSIITIACILELFLPWWSIAIAAFAGGIFANSNANFGAGFLAIASLWTAKALFTDLNAATLLTEKVAAIFQLPNKTLLYIIMSLIGGLVGGFSALSGSLTKKKRRLRY